MKYVLSLALNASPDSPQWIHCVPLPGRQTAAKRPSRIASDVTRSPWSKYVLSLALNASALMSQWIHCVPLPGRQTAAILPSRIASDVTRRPWSKYVLSWVLNWSPVMSQRTHCVPLPGRQTVPKAMSVMATHRGRDALPERAGRPLAQRWRQRRRPSG